MKSIVFFLLIALPGIGLFAGEPALLEATVGTIAEIAPAAGEVVAIKDGNALLDSLLVLFENLPVEKKVSEGEKKVSYSGLAEVGSRLSQLTKEAQRTLKAGVIDKIFYNRYERMLGIYKLIITPIHGNEMQKRLFMKTFEDFVWDTTYETWNWEDKDSIAKMAAAMEEEFIQIKIYLDTRQKYEALRMKIGKSMLPPPPPPPGKKKSEDKKPE